MNVLTVPFKLSALLPVNYKQVSRAISALGLSEKGLGGMDRRLPCDTALLFQSVVYTCSFLATQLPSLLIS